MKKKILIALGVASLVVALAFGGVIFYISKVITPEQIKAYAKQGIESALPSAQVEIGKIDLGVGTSVILGLEQLNLNLKNRPKGGGLLQISSATVRIPFWAILTGGGTVDVKLDSPTLMYREMEGTNNWELASKGKKKEFPSSLPKEGAKETGPVVKKKAERSKKGKVAIPAIATRINLDLHLKQLKVKYRLKDNSEGEVALDKLLIKNLGLQSSTAFELRSSVNVDLSQTQKLSLKALLIGELHLQDLINKENLQSVLMLKLSEIKMDGTGLSIPDIKTNVSANVGLNGKISGDLTTTFESSKIHSRFDLNGNNIALSKIDVGLLVADLLKISGQTISEVNPGKSKIALTGDVAIKNTKISPKLKLSLTPGMTVSSNGLSAAIKADANYDGFKAHSIVAVDMLKGSANLDLTGFFNINSKTIDLAKLKPFVANIKVSNLDLEEKLIRKFLYAKRETVKEERPSAKEEKQVTANGAKAKPVKAAPIILPRGKVNLDLVNIKVANQPLNGKGAIDISTNSITTRSLVVNYSGGECKVQHKSIFNPKGINSTFKLGLQTFNLLGIRPFLPQFVEAVTGHFSGNVNGTVKMGDTLAYNVKTNISARDGKVEGLKLGSFIDEFAGKLTFLKGKDFSVNSEKMANFQQASLRGTFTDRLYRVDSLIFIAVNKLIEIRGDGKVYPPPYLKKEGKLHFTVKGNNKFSQSVKKSTGTDKLPVLVKGHGFDLMPDYEYTVKAMGKVLAKQAVNKGKKKVNDYLKKNGKKQVKKLLKSFGF